MGNDDVLILTIYALVVFYVLYQMALSYEAMQEAKIDILLDTKRLEENTSAQLLHKSYSNRIQAEVEDSKLDELLKRFEEATGHKIPEKEKKKPTFKRLTLDIQPIFEQPPVPEGQPAPENKVNITVLPQGKKSLDPSIRFFQVNLNNRTSDHQVFVDWDRCSITYLNKESQRVIRVLPNESFDLFQPQVYSVINPGQQLRASVTAEMNIGRSESTQQLEVQMPAIDIGKIASRIASNKAKKDAKGEKENGHSKSEKQDSGKDVPGKGGYYQKSLYSLTLWVGIKSLAEQESQTVSLLLPFSFDVALVPGEIAFLPLRWLLNRPGKRLQNIVTTTITGQPARSRR